MEKLDLTEAFTVLVNASAGSDGSGVADRIAHALFEAGLSAHIERVSAMDLPGRAAALVREGAAALGVAGGDGTLSSVAAAVVGSETVLVTFPTGTLNHFARRLGISTVEETVAALKHGCVREIAVGSVNGRVFINNASCGFYPHLVRHRDGIRRWTGKWPGAFLAGAAVFATLPMLNVELETERERRKRRTCALWVGIGHGSFELPQHDDRPKTDARQLEIVIAPDASRLRLLNIAVRTLLGMRRHGRAGVDPRVETLQTPSFVLDATHAIDIARDGEAGRIDPPAAFTVHPKALRVLCPSA